MTVDELRKLRLADPFKPFRIVLVNGRELVIDKALYLAFSPTNKLMLYSTLAGDFLKFGIQQVKDVALIEPPKSAASGESPSDHR